MINLVYIRHGYPNYELDNLTELGKKQAEALRDKISFIKFDQVFASSCGRAVETAEIVTKTNRENIKALDWAKEDLAWEAFTEIFDKEGHKNWVFCIPSYIERFKELENDPNWFKQKDFGEKYEKRLNAMNQDIDNWLESIGVIHDRKNKTYQVKTDKDITIAFVAHGGMGTLFLSSILDLNYPNFVTRYGLLELTSFTHIAITDRAILVTYNDYSHIISLEN